MSLEGLDGVFLPTEWLSILGEFRWFLHSLYSWRPPRTQDNLKTVVSGPQDLTRAMPSLC